MVMICSSVSSPTSSLANISYHQPRCGLPGPRLAHQRVSNSPVPVITFVTSQLKHDGMDSQLNSSLQKDLTLSIQMLSTI